MVTHSIFFKQTFLLTLFGPAVFQVVTRLIHLLGQKILQQVNGPLSSMCLCVCVFGPTVPEDGLNNAAVLSTNLSVYAIRMT